ncbi:MAG: hypothetical protein R2712_28455 [Vicinamibacterales bacterium]
MTGLTLGAQQPKTLDERVTTLEKRIVGGAVDDGITRFTAPFRITDRAGKSVLSVDAAPDGSINVIIGDAAAGATTLGVGKSGAGFLALNSAKGTTVAGLGQYAGGPMGLRLFGPDGSTVQAAVMLDDDNRGRLQLGEARSGSVQAGVGSSGAGFLLVRPPDGSIGAFIGQYQKARMSVSVMGTGELPGATMFVDALGGNMRVMNPQGTPVGGLFSEEEGGGLVLTGPAGGQSVVDLGIRDSGGSVRVFSVGGSPARAALEADAKTGHFTTYNSEGRPVVTATSMPGGSGRFQVLHNGSTVVEAGVNSDGVGEVRAGPAAPRAVGALAIPYRIVGARGQ